MPINTFPIATVLPAANLISNVPAGSVTATDVQAAINQLAAAIPSPGSGTDPLFLVGGFNLTTYNPTFHPDATNRYAAVFNMTTTSAEEDPTFGNQTVAQFNISAVNGQNVYGFGNSAKESFFCTSNYAIYNAAGQKFLYNNTLQAFGMGDSAMHGNDYVQYAGGPVAGDEGQGWGLISNLTQQRFHSTATIVSVPAQSTVNTTTTMSITGSRNLQTVTVASAAGAVIGHWVIVQQQVASPSPLLEAVKIVNFSLVSNTIQGIFRNTHPSGVTVTPALRLFLDSTFQMGQDRLLVNHSNAGYSAGTVTAIAGAAFGGTSTGWSVGMVGGNATNIGAITLASDDYTQDPFDAGANRLRSWFQITSVSDAVSLSVYSFSVAGDLSYKGKGPGAGAYVIKPSAKILRIIDDGTTGAVTGEVICEQSTSTWAAGNSVECVICPYPDVTGFSYYLTSYTVGGTLRSFMDIRNLGPRSFGTAIQVIDGGRASGFDVDVNSFDTILALGAGCNYNIQCFSAKTAAISLPTAAIGFTDISGKISWSGPYIAPHSSPNAGLDIQGLISGGAAPNSGLLQFIDAGVGGNADVNSARLSFGGHLYLPTISFSGTQTGYILLDRITDPVNYERASLRWSGQSFIIGTERGGSGAARNIRLSTDGTTRQFIDADNSLVTYPNSGFGRSAPVTKTADFTLAVTDNWLINNKAGSTCTVTLGSPPAGVAGREVMFLNYQAQIVQSDAANVIPIGGGAAVQQILPATVGKWAALVFDGGNWRIMEAN